MRLTNREDLVFYAKMAQRQVGYIAGQLEITSRCEQFCPNCDSWKAHQSGEFRAEMGYAEIAMFFDELNRMQNFENLTLTGGDPVSHPMFEEILKLDRKFKLQINTALPLPIATPELWRERIDTIRLSLDGVTKETYYKMRGVRTDPEEILSRIYDLNHPDWATNTCVADANIHEMLQIIDRLGDMYPRNPRKASFIAVMDRKVSPEFWREYNYNSDVIRERKRDMEECPCNVHWHQETSVAEDVAELRKHLASGAADTIPCRVGGITFHIKCNGDVYPCCITGGEAIATKRDYCVGNIKKNSLSEIQRRYHPQEDYKTPVCRDLCQWKQFQMNALADRATKINMRIP